MATNRPTTIPEYIAAAPPEGQPHLQRVYEILQAVEPEADEAIKWGTPFFVEPRFLYSFSAHKAHLNFTPGVEGLEPFRDELAAYKVTPAGLVQIRYDADLPDDLIRRIAQHRAQVVSERDDDSFW